MNKALLKNLMTLKLKAVDRIIEAIPAGENSPVKNVYHDFLAVVNEVTGVYIDEKGFSAEKGNENGLKNIEIE